MKLNREMFASVDYSDQMTEEEVKKYKISAIFACFGILFFIPLIMNSNSKYTRFHAGQGLTYLLISICYSIIQAGVSGLLHLIHLGFIANIIGIIGSVFFFTLLIINLINTINGKSKTIPIIGRFNLISF